MTITKSYQLENQSTADIGARFDITQIYKYYSRNLKNDQALLDRANKEESIVQSGIFAPLNIISANIATLLVLGITLIRMGSKRA